MRIQRLSNALQAPPREDEQDIRDGDPEPDDKNMPDQEEDAVVRARRELRSQSYETGENHKPTDRVLRPACPCHQPARDERPADPDAENPLERALAPLARDHECHDEAHGQCQEREKYASPAHS